MKFTKVNIVALFFDHLTSKLTHKSNCSGPPQLHDCGYRGVSSVESAAIGGAAHMVNFRVRKILSYQQFVEEKHLPQGVPVRGEAPYKCGEVHGDGREGCHCVLEDGGVVRVCMASETRKQERPRKSFI